MDGVFPEISHNCWVEGSGSYSDFLRWRALLARASGIGTEIEPLGEFSRETPLLDYDNLTEANILGHWDEKPADVLVILLAHSDEAGFISTPDAARLADRLEELLPLLAEHSDNAPGSVLQKAEVLRTEQFIAGLRAAAESGEEVTFA